MTHIRGAIGPCGKCPLSSVGEACTWRLSGHILVIQTKALFAELDARYDRRNKALTGVDNVWGKAVNVL